MAVRAFTKVLFKQGQSLLDGLLQKSYLPRWRFPKQKVVNVADLGTKGANTNVSQSGAHNWLGQYAWKTLASDLRKRAAWQFSGRAAGRSFASGQRWLLFPAYGFVGLGLANKPVSAKEIDSNLDAITHQVKGMFEPAKDQDSTGETNSESAPCGRLIARGSRVALYKLHKQEESEDEAGAEEEEVKLEDLVPEKDLEDFQKKAWSTEETVDEVTEEAKIHVACEEVLPTDKPSVIGLHFTTDDGRQFQISLQVAPGITQPVSLHNVAVDGATVQASGSPSRKIKQMLSEAMVEEKTTKSETKAMAPETSFALPPYESMQSIEIIPKSKEVPSIVSDVLSDTAFDPNIRILPMEGSLTVPTQDSMKQETKPSDSASLDVSVNSDITIIDDTLELDLDFPDLEEPVFLDDLADDPLGDLKFVNHYEAINYLQTSNDGAYLLMTYFPVQDDDDMLSLNLLETGEQMWEAYDELLMGRSSSSSPAKQTTDTHNTTQSTTPQSNNTEDTSSGTKANENFHKVTQDEVKVAEKQELQSEPGGEELLMNENMQVSGENGVTSETYVEVSQKQIIKQGPNWSNRVPTTSELPSHPSITLVESSDDLMMNSDNVKVLQDELSTNTLSLLESVALFSQIADAVSHIDQNALIFRGLSSADILLSGESPWASVSLVVDKSRLYDKVTPRHLSYRDAVTCTAGNQSTNPSPQAQVILQSSDPGFSDESFVIRSLALIGLELFGARSPLANQDEDVLEWGYPPHIPAVFQRLLDAMLKTSSHKVFSCHLLSYCMHLLLWCPQSYFQGHDLVASKSKVTGWLTTFSAVTYLKSRSFEKSSVEIKLSEVIKLKMKLGFLSDLDSVTLSEAVKVVSSFI